MRVLLVVSTLCLLCGGAASAQVINGESTDDSAYAPRPPARWHSPESQGEVPGGRLDGDTRDAAAQSEKPRD